MKGGQIQVAEYEKHSLIKLDCLSDPFPPYVSLLGHAQSATAIFQKHVTEE